MAVPDFQSFFRPFLEAIADGEEHSMRDIHEQLAGALGLSEADLQETVRSGQQTKFNNRVSWTRTYFGKASIIEIPRRGFLRITERGRQLLEQSSQKITKNDLLKYPEFSAFSTPHQLQEPGQLLQVDHPSLAVSPEEQLETLHAELNASLASDLLEQVMQLSPQQFEVLVVRLLVAMGYGGSTRDAGEALGKTGDNGIDGVVKQDPLGLDRVYLQAKRWQNSVGSPEIRNFAGSLSYHKASKGVFITTSDFSENARNTAGQIGSIILIDGPQLARLMIEYGVGVITRTTYHVKRVDSEFFEEL